MRLLVRFAPTRVLLLVLADRGILRRRTEEALKADLLSRRRVPRSGDVVVLEPPGGAQPEARSAVR